MTNEDVKRLTGDPDGLLTYEYIANHIENCDADIVWLAENIIRVDLTGQFCASAARYLHAVDSEKFDKEITTLVSATIGKDREHRYLADLMISLYGSEYQERAEELSSSDDNFRRIYKRLFPTGF